MKLRMIVLILSALALLSTIAGGFLYYSAANQAAVQKIKADGAWHATSTRDLIDRLVVANLNTMRGMATLKALKLALVDPRAATLEDANQVLDDFKAAIDASVVYLMDVHGDTVASSNRLDPDSFVGKNYAFRPYFQQAMDGAASVYMALGVTSGLRGIYYSHAVYLNDPATPGGVVVMKSSVDSLEKDLLGARAQVDGTMTMVTAPNGLIFMSDSETYRYQLLEKMPAEATAEPVASQQFGSTPLVWSGFSPAGPDYLVDAAGNRYLVARAPLAALGGWQVVYMQDMQVMFAGVHTTFARNLGAVILLFYVFIGVSIAILYSMARGDIARRKRVEQALLESEEKFRSISASMNDCLMTIDDSGAITFWNETAQKIFGYTQAEVLGRELHPLLAPSRYLAAYKAAFSRFKENGDGMAIGKTLEMTALRKDGSEFPIELSLASYHSHGRWHAVGTVRDIADRKLAEQEKETLIADLQDALKEVRQLSGLLPICSHCKKIRDDKGYWNQIESYIQQHSEAQFSHSICQECAAKYYPDLGLYED